jgi:hypothetical protein
MLETNPQNLLCKNRLKLPGKEVICVVNEESYVPMHQLELLNRARDDGHLVEKAAICKIRK